MFNGDYMNRFLRRSDPENRLIWNKLSVKLCEKYTRIYESIHVAACFGYFVPSIMLHLANDDYKKAAYSFAINTVFNIYPIMLQRYNRGRYYNVLDRYSKNNKQNK